MIDIHSHILPGLDDGARTMSEALEMARSAARQGIRYVIATPHHANGRYETPAPRIKSAVAELNARLNQASITLTVFTGQEIRVFRELIDEWEQGSLCTLADSRYMLLELPSSHIPTYFGEIVHELVIRGIVPIIAHPERNAKITSSPNELLTYIAQGALCQLTANSLIGKFGRKIQRNSRLLCQSGMVHFIASDAHNCHNRAFQLKMAYEVAAKRLGKEREQLYRSNASRIIENRTILFESPRAIKRLKLWL